MNYKLVIRLGVAALLLAAASTVADARRNGGAVAAEQTAAGQVITVTGKVFDAQGQPLPGAGIVVKGTTNGTSADVDGNYSIRVGANQTLVVSFIGFKDQEVSVNGRATINVALQSDATALDETVVIGYGTIKRANLTGAVDVVDSKQFENRVAANVDQMLSGAMPNVYVASMDGAPYRNASNTSGYQIRGSWNTLAASNTAGDNIGSLVLIDGVEGDPSSLNPNDVESVSVLKDAAASAIYGSRGAFGVVLITTKNPTKEEKVTVTYSGNFNFMTPTAMPELLTDGEKYMDIRANANMNYQQRKRTVSNLWPASTNPFDVLDGYRDEAKQAAVVNGVYTKADGSYEYYGNTDWFDQIYKDNTSSQVHNLSVSGNNGRVSYLLSGRYYDYKGIYVGKSDPYRTYNLRSKVNVNITDWLSLGENIEYSDDKIDYAITSEGSGRKSPQSRVQDYGAPVWPVYNNDGTFTKAGAYILSGLIGDAYDPVSYERKGQTRTTTHFRTTTSLEAKFLKDALRIKGDWTYRKKDLNTETKNTGNYFSNGQDDNGDAIMSFSQTGDNVLKQHMLMSENSTVWTVANLTAEYENTFGKHWVKGMAGMNYETRDRYANTYYKYGLGYWDANAGNPWAYATGTLSTNGDVTGVLVTDGITEKHWRNQGFFFRANYSFDDRYLVELNGRYDGSSVFVNDYQWGFFPSASAAWRPSQEPWWHVDPRYISSLKLRLSYGELGDCMSAGAYNTEDTFSIKEAENRVINGQSPYRYFAIPSSTAYNYTWSTVKTFNVGFDASFLSNRLDITYDYFIKRNIDMLTVGTQHTDTYGQDNQLGNNADMSTYGWELSVKFNQPFMLAGKPANFGISAAIGNNWTIIDRFEGNQDGYITSWNYHKGQRVGKIYGFRSNGLFQNQDQIDNAFGEGKPYKADSKFIQHRVEPYAQPGDIWIKDLDGDGVITYGNQTLDDHGDLDIVADKWPRFPFSFSVDFGWNNWYLNAKFQGVLHQDFIAYGGFLALNAYGKANGPMTKWFVDQYWTPENTDAIFPALSQGNKLFNADQTSNWSARYAKYPIDKYVFDAGYLNLQNLQIGYNVPASLLKKVKLSAARVYFSGENIWNWSPFYRTFGRDYDVTTVTFGGGDPSDGLQWADQGFGFQYPKLRTFSLGITITY